MNPYSLSYRFYVSIILLFALADASASTATLVTHPDIGSVGKNITDSFSSLAKLLTGGSYLLGLVFFISAVIKFKQHKDNPTQVPIGTSISLGLIAGIFLFLPSILDVMGFSVFGHKGGETPGPHGTVYHNILKGK